MVPYRSGHHRVSKKKRELRHLDADELPTSILEEFSLEELEKAGYGLCDSCGKVFKLELLKKYWFQNTLSSMLLGVKAEKRELWLCPKCLKKTKRSNAIIVFVGLLVFLVMPFIWLALS